MRRFGRRQSDGGKGRHIEKLEVGHNDNHAGLDLTL